MAWFTPLLKVHVHQLFTASKPGDIAMARVEVQKFHDLNSVDSARSCWRFESFNISSELGVCLLESKSSLR